MEHLYFSGDQAVIDLPHTRYLDKVLRSNSYEELMWRFSNAESPSKEITESYAAFSNLKKICMIHDYNWLHIGDGGHTRTAALFTFISKSVNFSIDPQLNLEKFEAWKNRFNVRGIVPFKSGFEEVDINEITGVNDKPYNICCVHAHVNLEEVDSKFPDWTYLYTNPCCKPQKQTFSKDYMKDHGIKIILEREDLGILSDKRSVIVYEKIKQ